MSATVHASKPAARSSAAARSQAEALLGSLASIRRSARLLARRPEEFAALTEAQMELVRLLRRRGPLSVAAAAGELRLAPNTVSTLVRQLRDAGVVTRGSDSRDRRVARLELVPEVAAKVNAFRDRRAGLLAEAIETLPPSQRRSLPAALELLGVLADTLPSTRARTSD